MQETSTTAHLDTLAEFPAALRQRLQALSESALRFKPAPSEWSIVEIVGHLGDVEAQWDGRVRQMLAAENPTFANFDPDAMVIQQQYQQKQAGGLLSAFAERRGELLAFVRQLRPAQLARTGIHPVRGQLSVADALGILAWHDQNHLKQIEANLTAFGL